MATVSGFTSDRMLEIENAAIVSGAIVGDDLILEPKGFATSPGTYPKINAGDVRGPTGATGPTGEVSTAAMNAAIAAAHADGAIAGSQLADSGVVSAKLADGSVIESKIATNAVTVDKLGTGSVISSKIGSAQITSTHMANNSVQQTAIQDGAVVSAKLGTSAVIEAKIANSAVTNSKIANSAVNGSKIANDSIDSQHYVDGSIDHEHISANAVMFGNMSKTLWRYRLGTTQEVNGVSDVTLISTPSFSPAANGLLIISASWDFQCDVLGSPAVPCIGKIFINGSQQEEQTIFTASAAGQRTTVSRTLILPTWAFSGGNVSITATKNGSFGTYLVNDIHTALSVLYIPF
ncbi:hypothetical protein KC887_04145 [Candidatus Kaiserbacteria bacterium]|nr:hypothetical protein [Candidatus Kaiserbacteria bacterium]